MKTLTLHQPWASLIAIGVKTIETRSWSTDYRGRLAIHAGARPPEEHLVTGEWKVFCNACCLTGNLPWVIEHFANEQHPLPLGALVATAELLDVVPILVADICEEVDLTDLPYPRIESSLGDGDFPDGWLELYHPVYGNQIDPETGASIPHEASYGDFTPGRYAWLLGDVKPTTERCPACWGAKGTSGSIPYEVARYRTPCSTCEGEGSCSPVPAKGHQGLWEWTPERFPVQHRDGAVG